MSTVENGGITQGQLVSLAQIDATIADGGLLMSTQNPQQTQAILNLMRQQ